MNWGTGILIFYSVFVFSMVGVVLASRKHDPGLVSDKYYDLDLNYQKRMEQKQNTASLSKAVEIRYVFENRSVEVQFPAEIGTPSGNIVLYRPSDGRSDVKIPINCDASGKMTVPVESLSKGLWRVNVDWTAGGKSYFQENVMHF